MQGWGEVQSCAPASSGLLAATAAESPLQHGRLLLASWEAIHSHVRTRLTQLLPYLRVVRVRWVQHGGGHVVAPRGVSLHLQAAQKHVLIKGGNVSDTLGCDWCETFEQLCTLDYFWSADRREKRESQPCEG